MKFARAQMYSASLIATALLLSSCSSATPGAAPTAPSAQPTAAAKPTTAPAAPAAQVAVSNPPTTPEMVDAIDLKGKNVEVTYWHNRAQADQDMLQSML